MQTLKKNPWIIGVTLLALGGVGYFLYKRAKKRPASISFPTKPKKGLKVLGKQVTIGTEG